MPPPLTVLDLFTGIGGMTLALRDLVQPLCYCEIDPHAVAILQRRMADGQLPTAPVCPDVRRIRPSAVRPDCLLAGFPCQGFSCVGSQTGFAHHESGLFGEIVRVVDDCHPECLFLENVPTILPGVPHTPGARATPDRKLGIAPIVDAFVSRGYDVRWGVLAARDVVAEPAGPSKGDLRAPFARCPPRTPPVVLSGSATHLRRSPGRHRPRRARGSTTLDGRTVPAGAHDAAE